jgi:superfamily II DNA/RNA helicase
MYSQQLQNYLKEVSLIAGIEPENTRLLDESLLAYLYFFSQLVGGVPNPSSDLLSITVKLLSLSVGLTETDLDVETDGSHYLVAMGLEQSGELLSRIWANKIAEIYPPLSNDYWYRLLLAFLHYMAGGHRVQAVSALRHIERISKEILNAAQKDEYTQATAALWNVFRARPPRVLITPFEVFLFGVEEPVDLQGRKIFRLAQKIRRRRQVALSELGMGKEIDWLHHRGIIPNRNDTFWEKYLNNLEGRGFTNFTDEQRGEGFDDWLVPDTNLLVILPTGSGKTLVGELKTALTLAQGFQTVWMLPTRALVRQAKRELASAFKDLDVEVEELPTTEDFIPQFVDELSDQRLVAATTPEKIAALIRSNPNAISKIRLVVLDEAQILFENRGTTAEHVLQEIHRLVPECKFILMSAFDEVLERLRSFMFRLLGDNPKLLVSNARPTRRINGVITNANIDEVVQPVISIYPSGIQNENIATRSPYRVFFPKQKLPKGFGSTDLAKSISVKIIGSELRAVVFVGTVTSTETQAVAIAKKTNQIISLPELDIARLKVELGRQSIIEQTSVKRIAPHHAGLTPLEQHVVEKWTRQNLINLVVATPTLAQGVNLPFDLSIVSFLKRRNPITERSEDIPVPEIMNMLGRAGRAGHVSDGMCLIAIPSSDGSDANPLRSAKKYFFRINKASRKFLGLANLLSFSADANISRPEWLIELDKMKFDQAQTLVAFSLLAATEGGEIKKGISDRLALYPSIQDLVDDENDEKNSQEKVIAELTASIEPLVQNIIKQSNGDNDLIKAATRTGMPIEILQYLLGSLREADNDLRNKTPQDALLWADDKVFEALNACSSRTWYLSFLSEIHKKITLDNLRSVVDLWRSGAPLAKIENELNIGRTEKENRINVGKLINQKISLIGQFWGALAVCDEILYPEERRRPFELAQTFVREGISSLAELVWLNRIGGLDRVLAHRLAQLTPEQVILSDRQTLSRYVRRRLNQWRLREEIIPIEELSTDEAGALSSVLQEI